MVNDVYKNKIIAAVSVFLVGCLFLIIISVFTEGKKENVIPEGAIILEAEVAEVYGNADGIVTIVSDDGDYITSINLYRLMRERGLKCTVAGVITTISEHLNVWDKYVEEGVFDLVSHSYDHVRMDEESEIAKDRYGLIHEIVDADDFLENSFGREQVAFVCPENQMCENGYIILKGKGLWAVRRGNRGYNSLGPDEGTEAGQWYNLSSIGIGDSDELQVRNSWVDAAADEGLWLIEMWHNVRKEYDGCYQTLLIPDAEEHLDYIAEMQNNNQIWVATLTEATKYIRERQNSRVISYIDNNSLYLKVELVNEEMDYDIFNQPLTVSVDIPDGYSLKVGSFDENENGRMLIDVIPGREYSFELAKN